MFVRQQCKLTCFRGKEIHLNFDSTDIFKKISFTRHTRHPMKLTFRTNHKATHSQQKRRGGEFHFPYFFQKKICGCHYELECGIPIDHASSAEDSFATTRSDGWRDHVKMVSSTRRRLSGGGKCLPCSSSCSPRSHTIQLAS